VKTVTQDGRDVTIISIEGEFRLGDEKRFADAAIHVSDAIVALSSPGGAFLQAWRSVERSG
jgi:hypothetical protein